MAITYINIASTTLSSSVSSVTFSSISNAYTDLLLKYSTRTDGTGNVFNATFRFNSDSATNYSGQRLYGDGAAAGSNIYSNRADLLVYGSTPGNQIASNTFSNNELYIPNYLASQNKPIGSYNVTESNAAGNAQITAVAALWRNTAAINSITIFCGSTASPTDNFIAGSTFYLYGIKNN